jgi:hypothetical protein
MFALDRTSRALLAGAAFAAFAGAFVTAPFVADGAAGIDALHPARPAPLVTAIPFAIVLPRRDPFAGEPPAAQRSIGEGTPSGLAAPRIPVVPEIPAAIRPLPPNAGAAGFALPFTAGTRVTAVVTGSRPFALVDEGGTSRVVTIGDHVDGNAIAAITPDGVRLSTGATIPIAAPSSAPPTPTRSAASSSATAWPIAGGRP